MLPKGSWVKALFCDGGVHFPYVLVVKRLMWLEARFVREPRYIRVREEKLSENVWSSIAYIYAVRVARASLPRYAGKGVGELGVGNSSWRRMPNLSVLNKTRIA